MRLFVRQSKSAGSLAPGFFLLYTRPWATSKVAPGRPCAIICAVHRTKVKSSCLSAAPERGTMLALNRVTAIAAAIWILSSCNVAMAQSESQWQKYTGPQGSYTAEIPGPPKLCEPSQKTHAGTAYTMHQVLVELGPTAFVVQTAAYPMEVNVSKPRANLQGGLDSAAKNMKEGKWEKVAWGKHRGLEAVEAIGEREGHAIRSYSVMKGHRIVTLTYAGPLGSAQSKEATRFFKSLIAP